MFNNNSSKRKGKINSNNTRPNLTRHKGGSSVEKNITTEGIYGNPRFLQATSNIVGCVMFIQVKNGDIFEGIFQTFSSQFEVALEMVHKIDKDNKDALPTEDQIVQKMIFKPNDIVMMTTENVDLEYGIKDPFATDSDISKFNGKVTERELEQWDDSGCNVDESIGFGNDDANGWGATEMFKTNKEKYGLETTFDSSLSGYTVALEKQNTDEYRMKEERAKKIASEIESSQGYKQRLDMENGDEENLYSAVVRPKTHDQQQTNNNNGHNRYMQSAGGNAGKKKPTNKGFSRPPQQPYGNSNNVGCNMSATKPSSLPPQQRNISSPAHHQPNRGGNQVSRAKPPPYCPHVSQDLKNAATDGARNNSYDRKGNNQSSSGVGETKGDTPKQLQSQTDKQKVTDKPPPPNSQVKSSAKNEEIAGLKKFSADLDIEIDKSEGGATAKAGGASEADNAEDGSKKAEKVNDPEETTLATKVKNSKLNPNAKEFFFSPRAFTPRSPQTTTPPTRPQATQSPNIPPPTHMMGPPYTPSQMIPQQHWIPGQQTVFTTMATITANAPPHQTYMMTPQQANVSLTPFNQVMAATMPQVARFKKVQAAAATGPPLLAPGHGSIPVAPTKFTVPYPPPQGMVAAGPGGGPHTMMPYHQHPHQQMYSIVSPRLLHPTTMNMVPPSASAINYDQHAHTSQMYCTTSLPGHQNSNGAHQQGMVSMHGMMNHSTTTMPVQSQAMTPGGGGGSSVHPSPSPVHHHQGGANQPNGVPPPQPMVFHQGGQMGPPPPAPHQLQQQHGTQNTSGNGHHQQQQQTTNAVHLQHGSGPMAHNNQHSAVAYHPSGGGHQQMLILPPSSVSGTPHPQSVLQSNSRTLQALHGANNGGNGVIPVLQPQVSTPLHYIHQTHSQPTTVYHPNQ